MKIWIYSIGGHKNAWSNSQITMVDETLEIFNFQFSKYE